ncbi:MAG: phosphoribosylglycinamide formyltransferase [Clostridiales bacterium]|jgi:phosphoribosylglycinamide formyltransferase-1|nr:phosphoribosylglycinamide formyltransferase [Clostridiales bacterium]
MNTNKKINVAVFVSGGGTNLQALIDAVDANIITRAKLSLVVSNNANAYAIKRAQSNNIPVLVIQKDDNGYLKFENKVIKALEMYDIDIIVLAGFMQILSKDFTKKYENRIINIHPSLIPSFCGKGYYGLRVHKATLEYGVKLTGATVHYVNEVPDGGKIIMQKAVRVLKNDTPETLQKRVMEKAEQIILPRAVELVARKMLKEKK